MPSVYSQLIEKRKSKTLLFALLDPDKFTKKKTKKLFSENKMSIFDAYLVGGSTAVWQDKVDEVVKTIKQHTTKPVIIFPSSISNLTPYADAVLFLSLLNSSNTFYIIEQQFQAAPIIRKMGLEAISTAYIIVGDGGTAGYVGHARPIPYDKPELAAAYALAAEYLGFKFVYLEAGSGAKRPIQTEVVRHVKEAINIPLIVGGGVREWDYVNRLKLAGADGIVVGNLLEDESALQDFIEKSKQKL